MKKKEPRSLDEILSGQPNSLFSRLERQQAHNDTLLSRIRAVLAPQIAQHVVAVTYREEILVLVADSAAWANRLRFESENLRKKLIDQAYFAHPGVAQEARPYLAKIVTRTAASNLE